MRASEHFYIDSTFLYTKGFSQLIAILYIDGKSGKRYPGLYALINNKKEEGYKILFNNINFILTLENQNNLNIKTYCVDFEKALINATKEVFLESRQIGYYYHYCRNIREKARDFRLYSKILKNDSKSMLNDSYKLPFIYHDNKDSFDIIENLAQNFKDYLHYFENQWLPYFY